MTDQTLDQFIAKWANAAASERANCQPFLTGLCELLDLATPQPATANPAEDIYCFERPVIFHHPDGSTSSGYIDLYQKGHFVLEAKQGVSPTQDPQPISAAAQAQKAKLKKGHGVRGTSTWDTALQKARAQAENYARALPPDEGRPPFVIVVDVGHCIELYAEFSRSGGAYLPFPDPRTHRILLKDLAREDIRERLQAVWRDPMSLDPSRKAAKVTREIADALAKLAKSLETSAPNSAAAILAASGERRHPDGGTSDKNTSKSAAAILAASGERRQDDGGTSGNTGGHSPKAVAEFLMRCLFTMFAEDVKLLPKDAFKKLLDHVATAPEKFKPAVEDLWRVMNTGGFHSASMEKVLRFNGGLFATPNALPLNKDQLQFLAEAAAKDWSAVEPAIFGTLLERALNPHERHKLGAHYTPRAYVERLVIPTVIEPLREEWQAVQAAALTLADAGKEKEAHKEIHAFHRRLCAVRVLDPACGSGNFLYVTLEHLKRLEGEIFNTLHDLGESQTLIEAEGLTVDPHQLLGIEINPRAAVIAELVLWIGYLQWHYRTHGDLTPPEPVIKNFKNIENRDAVLDYDKQEIVLDQKTLKPLTRWDGRTTKTHPITGEQVPDDTARIPVYKYTNPRPAKWPDADYVVGNPPFIGTARMREALGDGYTECIRATIKEVPESSDFVMYWWNHAAHLTRQGKLKRFGFITTNSLRQTFNRRVLEHHMNADDPVSLAFAIPDHPWVDSGDGAAVRIAMTVGVSGAHDGATLEIVFENGELTQFKTVYGTVSPSLTINLDVHITESLAANEGIAIKGFELGSQGFLLSTDTAASWLKMDPKFTRVIHPYMNGRDLKDGVCERFVVDFFGLSETEAQEYGHAYQHVLVNVKPERTINREARTANNWWLFRRSGEVLRNAIDGLDRYIATTRTAKHRVFQFVMGNVYSESKIVTIALSDGFSLGILSSRPHVVFSTKIGGWLGVGNDPTYNHMDCFNKFPFPDATEAQKARIRALGERLNAHRKARQAAHPTLTMTGMYNVLEKLRAIDKASQRASESAAVILTASGGGSADDSSAVNADQERRQDDGGTLQHMPQALDLSTPINIHQGHNLPHWSQDGVAYFVTFRLADSIAHEEGEAWVAERTSLLEQAQSAPEQERILLEKRAQQLMSEKFEALLDAGLGACVLRDPQAAQVIADSLRHFDNTRYRLWAWCVMPNHVHAVVEPLAGHALADIVASWKSFSATKINKMLGRTGALWRKEYFDHAIRSQASFEQKIQYTLDNPKNAGLSDWPWLGHRAPSAAAILAASGSERAAAILAASGSERAAAILAASSGTQIPGRAQERRQDDGGTLTPKEREIHDQGLVSILKELHHALDAAVFDAYGWPADLNDEQILERLVALNAERAAEEKRGIIRYLRPEFQDPNHAKQTQIDIPEDEEVPAKAKPTRTAKLAWPKDLPGQAQAVRNALRNRPSPATPAQIAATFKNAKIDRVQEILDALAALGQANLLPDDHYQAP